MTEEEQDQVCDYEREVIARLREIVWQITRRIAIAEAAAEEPLSSRWDMLQALGEVCPLAEQLDTLIGMVWGDGNDLDRDENGDFSEYVSYNQQNRMVDPEDPTISYEARPIERILSRYDR